MMEIKCYKSTLIELHFIFFNLGPTCPGPSCYGADLPRADLAKGRIVQYIGWIFIKRY